MIRNKRIFVFIAFRIILTTPSENDILFFVILLRNEYLLKLRYGFIKIKN